jgi:hypothetical protein
MFPLLGLSPSLELRAGSAEVRSMRDATPIVVAPDAAMTVWVFR